MAKSKIEWLRNSTTGAQGFSINPVKGLCPVGCDYCYARRMYKRFKWNPEIRYPTGLFPYYPPGSKVFMGSTMELFGDWVRPDWMQNILTGCLSNRMSTFIFLTKRPENLMKWSPFPPNCWVGVSATNELMAAAGCAWLSHIDASVKFLSIEPLLSWNNQNANNSLIGLGLPGISWLIIGQQTPSSPKTSPKVEWVREIVEVADRAGIPVFLKDNLYPIVCPTGHWDAPFYKEVPFYGRAMRQEFPGGKQL